MQKRFSTLAMIGLCLLLTAGAAGAASFKSYSSVLSGGRLIDFEGQAEGTLIENQYFGLTFGQAPLAGRPQIDVYPWLMGYGCSSGSAVLTGSTEGGYPAATIAGITVSFPSPLSQFQVFFSDTSPLGDYTVTAYDALHNILDSFTIFESEILPSGYSGDIFPSPGTTPLPGLFVGFIEANADIYSVQIGPSNYAGTLFYGDSFAIDDLRYAPAPVPGALVLLGSGLVCLAGCRRLKG